MGDFASSHLGKLREVVGNRLLLLPGARVIIENEKGEFLLQLRSDFKIWGLIGGNVEPGESIEQMLSREVKEEVGIDLLELKPFGYGSNPELESHTFPNGHMTQYFSLVFHCRKYSGEPAIMDDESLELGWFDEDHLPEMVRCSAESLKAFKRFRETGEFQMF